MSLGARCVGTPVLQLPTRLLGAPNAPAKQLLLWATHIHVASTTRDAEASASRSATSTQGPQHMSTLMSRCQHDAAVALRQNELPHGNRDWHAHRRQQKTPEKGQRRAASLPGCSRPARVCPGARARAARACSTRRPQRSRRCCPSSASFAIRVAAAAAVRGLACESH